MPNVTDYNSVFFNILAAFGTGVPVLAVAVDAMPHFVVVFTAAAGVVAICLIKVNKINNHMVTEGKNYTFRTAVCTAFRTIAVLEMHPRAEFIAADAARFDVTVLIIIVIDFRTFRMIDVVGNFHIFSAAGSAFILAADSIMVIRPIEIAFGTVNTVIVCIIAVFSFGNMF